MSTRDLGTVEVLGVEAIGQPGQRHFRLFARGRTSAALLWMEKEQLLNLSLVIDRILAQVSEGRILRIEASSRELPYRPTSLPGDFPIPPDYDIQVGQIRLNFSSARATFLLTAIPFEITENEQGEAQIVLQGEETLSLTFTLEQARELTGHINALASGGRPVCPLCHTPLDGGPHTCVKQNGHRKIVQVIMDDENDD